jgi:hypothetical protein
MAVRMPTLHRAYPIALQQPTSPSFAHGLPCHLASHVPRWTLPFQFPAYEIAGVAIALPHDQYLSSAAMRVLHASRLLLTHPSCRPIPPVRSASQRAWTTTCPSPSMASSCTSALPSGRRPERQRPLRCRQSEAVSRLAARHAFRLHCRRQRSYSPVSWHRATAPAAASWYMFVIEAQARMQYRKHNEIAPRIALPVRAAAAALVEVASGKSCLGKGFHMFTAAQAVAG